MPIISAYVVPHPPLLLPEVGRGQEKAVAATAEAYRRAAAHLARLAPETVVLLSPHAVTYADYFHISPGEGASGDMRAFGAKGPETKVLYDREFVQALGGLALREGFPAGTAGQKEKGLDHGSLVPLRFFQEALPGFRVVRIGVSGLPLTEHYRLGQLVAETAGELNRSVAVIASGDLSHRLKSDGPYGFDPAGPAFDRRLTEALAAGDFLELLRFEPDFCQAAGECGLRPFAVMAGTFDGRRVKANPLSYEGPFGVGYGVCVIEGGEADPDRFFGRIYQAEEEARLAALREKEDIYVRVARYAAERYVREKKRLSGPAELPADLAAALTPEMTETRAGAFVSLKLEGQLRGCIGTVGPTQSSLLNEILRNAVSACAEDPRFDPVEPPELSRLVISVDVLGKPEPIDSMEQLDVRRYGVIVTGGAGGYRRGLLLPDLAGVDTPARQVEIALQKAGIKKGGAYAMERFEVIRHC